jgi:predicted RNase H-like HicB family nuclease
MLTRYLAGAMRHAHYELVPEDGSFFGAIPGFDGVWASAETLEACREELSEVLEEWVVLGLRMGHELPPVDGIRLEPQVVA